MRTGNAALQAKTHGLRRQRLDMARHRIVAFVAMDIDRQPAFSGNAAEFLQRGCAISHGALKMRNAADDVEAHIERAVDEIDRARRTVVTILREGHELQIDVRLHLLAHFDHRFSSEKARIADIDMAANGQQALRNGQIAITQRALDHGFNGQHRLQFAPERDAFKKRTGTVEAWQAKRQGRVHMEMRIDERRGHEPVGRIDFLSRLMLPLGGPDIGNLAVLDQNVLLLATVGEIGVSHDQIEHRQDLSSGYARTELKNMGSFSNCLIPYIRWAQCRGKLEGVVILNGKC